MSPGLPLFPWGLIWTWIASVKTQLGFSLCCPSYCSNIKEPRVLRCAVSSNVNALILYRYVTICQAAEEVSQVQVKTNLRGFRWILVSIHFTVHDALVMIIQRKEEKSPESFRLSLKHHHHAAFISLASRGHQAFIWGRLIETGLHTHTRKHTHKWKKVTENNLNKK